MRCIDQGGGILSLTGIRRRDRTVQLSADAFSTELYGFIKDICRILILLIRIECCRIILYKCIDPVSDPVVCFIKASAVDIFINQFLQICMIAFEILFIRQQRIKEFRS